MERRVEPGMGDLAGIDVGVRTRAPFRDGVPARSAWLAALLGLMAPLVAFAYVGRLGTGLLLTLAIVATFVLFGQSGLIQSIGGICAGSAVAASLWLAQFGLPWFTARRHRGPYRRRWYNRWYFYLLLALLPSLAGHWILQNRAVLFGYATYRVASASMSSTLVAGDWVIVDTRQRGLQPVGRNDLIVYRHPSGHDYVHRVIGLPGETLVVEAGGVTVDGAKLDEPFVQGADGARHIEVKRLTLGAGEYFVMGDNRGHSFDSRSFGPVFANTIIGRASAIVYAPELGRIGSLR